MYFFHIIGAFAITHDISHQLNYAISPLTVITAPHLFVIQFQHFYFIDIYLKRWTTFSAKTEIRSIAEIRAAINHYIQCTRFISVNFSDR